MLTANFVNPAPPNTHTHTHLVHRDSALMYECGCGSTIGPLFVMPAFLPVWARACKHPLAFTCILFTIYASLALYDPTVMGETAKYGKLRGFYAYFLDTTLGTEVQYYIHPQKQNKKIHVDEYYSEICTWV